MRETPRPTHWIDKEGSTGLVSVVVPSYNRAHEIIETLESVRGQTYRPIELIVVDDGSRDETEAVVKDWLRELPPDPDFTARFHRQQNQGAPAARNYGARESAGEFIQFLDSDDLLGPTKLASQVDFLNAHPELGACFVQIYRFCVTDHGVQVQPYLPDRPNPGEDYLNNLLKQNPFNIHSHSPLWRRELVWQTGPWREDLSANQDGDFLWRALLGGCRIARCPQGTAYYRRSVGRERGSIQDVITCRSARSRFRSIRSLENRIATKNMLDVYRIGLCDVYYSVLKSSHKDCPPISALCRRKIKALLSSRSLPIRLWIWIRYSALGKFWRKVWHKLRVRSRRLRGIRDRFTVSSIEQLYQDECQPDAGEKDR